MTPDQLVQDYLATVAEASADLPRLRRADLLVDLSEHIASARADLDPETEAGVRTILARLGDPASIAQAARLELTPPPVTAKPLLEPPPPVVAPPRRSTPGWAIALISVVGAVVVVCVGVMVFGFAVSQNPASQPAEGIVVSEPPPSPSPTAGRS